MTVATVLLVIALVCLVLAAFGVNAGRVSLGWLGLSFVILAALIGPVVLR